MWFVTLTLTEWKLRQMCVKLKWMITVTLVHALYISENMCDLSLFGGTGKCFYYPNLASTGDSAWVRSWQILLQ